jgi:hypothetical protein
MKINENPCKSMKIHEIQENHANLENMFIFTHGTSPMYQNTNPRVLLLLLPLLLARAGIPSRIDV